MRLQRIGGDRLTLGVDTRSNHVRALVHVREEESRRDSRAVMESRAAISMAASTDLEVERAVHTVFLCPENRRQVLRHCCGGGFLCKVKMIVGFVRRLGFAERE